MNKKIVRHYVLFPIITLMIISIDLVSKTLTDGRNAEIINGVVGLYSAHNTGAAWSILSDKTWLLVLLSIVFIALIIIVDILFKRKHFLYTFGLGLIMGGAIGNLVDRIFLHYVRDFIELQFISFPIFNIADMSLTIGVVLICIFLLFVYPSQEKKKVHND